MRKFVHALIQLGINVVVFIVIAAALCVVFTLGIAHAIGSRVVRNGKRAGGGTVTRLPCGNAVAGPKGGPLGRKPPQ